VIDVLCIGHAAWDLILTLPGYPAEDSKSEVTRLDESGGGPAANAAWLLASWGVRCAFAGLVGDDEYGRRVLQEFAQVGMDTSLVECRPGYPTPVSVILVNERNGSRTVANRTVPAAGLSLSFSRGEELAPRVLLFDGHDLEASLQAIERFPRAKTVLDAGSLREGTRELARRVDFLVGSERFARQVIGLPPLDAGADRTAAVAALHRLNGHPVVITLGERGLIHGTASGCEYLPAFPAQAVDTTAAGDVFHGAFAYGVLSGLSWLDTLRLASMAAALSVAVPGGRRSIPSLERVRAALAEVGA
jgi:sugar/nucleoside kinase (ribokinase family)